MSSTVSEAANTGAEASRAVVERASVVSFIGNSVQFETQGRYAMWNRICKCLDRW
jgi:hypothetical protein